MKAERITLGGMPALCFGEPRERVYLSVHGKFGCKEESSGFADIACARGWQVVAVDLPGHGERKREADGFVPWRAAPELRAAMKELSARWARAALFAGSIGAYFSLRAFPDAALEKCLFVSPLLDMEGLIERTMARAGVSEERLRLEGEIPVEGADPLSYRYLLDAREHPIRVWNPPTAVLCAGRDALTPREAFDAFCARFGARLTVMEDGEHWFHTPAQLQVLQHWMEENV